MTANVPISQRGGAFAHSSIACPVIGKLVKAARGFGQSDQAMVGLVAGVGCGSDAGL